MALWDNYDRVTFEVVANPYGQHSIWPTTRPRPDGWRTDGFAGSRQACLAEIDRRAAGVTPARPTPQAPAREGPEAGAAPAGTTDPPEEMAVLRGRHRTVPDTSIMSLIRASHLPPEGTAARCGADHVTRGALLAASAAWAQVLSRAGCGREVPVAVLLPRGLPALTAILAVLEAGGAYVPLSCDAPAGRVQAILDDCRAPIVITTGELRERHLRLYSGAVLTPSELADRAAGGSAAPPAAAAADDLAYVFYTSGTTGEPKGVEGTHRQLVNYALWCRDAFAHRAAETTFLSASLFFLGSLTTIFTPLLAGWPIVVAPDESTTDDLLELSRHTEAGLLKLTPTHLRMMLARSVPERGLARQLMVGSESLTFTRELKRWMEAEPGRVVANHYGLTETHGCFCHRLTGDEEIGRTVPIGTPIDNVEAYLVDRNCDPVGVGEIGELLVGGPSMGRGYRHRPALTAERWIPHPWGVDGARLLRTGDLARLDPDGAVTIVGRADRQLKIRGHRVEPAAVEETLRGMAQIKEALVLPRFDVDNPALDAFLVRDGAADIDPASVRDELAQRFPPQWIPGRLAIVSEFPVNANGKVDTHALPEPVPVSRTTHSGPEAERWSSLDRAVADAFCDVLRIDDIGLWDDFYDLGGDSFASVAVAARVGKALGRDVPAPTAEAATVRAYAQRVASPVAHEAPRADVRQPQ